MAHPPGKLCVIMSYHVCPDMQLYPKFYALHRTIAAHLFNSLAGVHYVWFDPKCVTQNQRWEGRNKSRNGFSPQSLSLVGYVLGKAGGRFSTQEKTNREHLWSFLCSLSISRCHTTPTPPLPIVLSSPIPLPIAAKDNTGRPIVLSLLSFHDSLSRYPAVSILLTSPMSLL